MSSPKIHNFLLKRPDTSYHQKALYFAEQHATWINPVLFIRIASAARDQLSKPT